MQPPDESAGPHGGSGPPRRGGGSPQQRAPHSGRSLCLQTCPAPQCLSSLRGPLHHGNTRASRDFSWTCLQDKRPWAKRPTCHLCTLSQTSSKMQVPLRFNVLKDLLPKPSQDHPFPGQVAQPSPPWSRTPRIFVHKEIWVTSLICNWETGADSRKPS